MPIELHQLRYFVAAAEAGGISRAAEHCHVAQPSLSQQIRKLESQLGVTLFDRLSRGITLTDAGRALVPRARAILDTIRDVEASLPRDVTEGAGSLTVGAIPTMAPYLLPRAVLALRQERPTCALSIREDLTEHLVEALLNLELDCAVLSTPLDHGRLSIDVIGEEELVAIMPRDHALSASVTVPVRRFQGLPTVSLEDIHCLGRQIRGLCGTRHVAPRIVCRTTQLATVFDLVGLGLGVSIVPEMAAAAASRTDVVYRRLSPRLFTRQVAVAWRRDRTRPRAATEFVALLRRQLADGIFRLPAHLGRP